MKQDTPETNDNAFLKDGKIDTEVIAKFKSALDADKDFDVKKALGIEESKPQTKTEAMFSDADIAKLKEMQAYATSQLTKAGITAPVSESDSKFSEFEKTMKADMEKVALAKFSEQKQSLLAIDPDFSMDVIDNMTIPTPDKLSVVAAFSEVSSRYTKAISKLQSELDNITSELKEAQARSPAPEPQTGKSGSDIVKAMGAKFGLKIDDKSGEKTE